MVENVITSAFVRGKQTSVCQRLPDIAEAFEASFKRESWLDSSPVVLGSADMGDDLGMICYRYYYYI